MVEFEIKETSHITLETKYNTSTHTQMTDAMENAIKWLALEPVGSEVIITEKVTVKRIK